MREPFTVRLPADLVAAVRARARDEGASTAEGVAGALRQQLDKARADARHWEERAAWEARRYAWARECQAQQRNKLGLRPSLEECLNEYERAVPAPMRREPA